MHGLSTRYGLTLSPMKISGVARVIFHVFLSSTNLLQNQLFQKIISGITPECQTAWIQICRAWSGKSYQRMTLGGKELKILAVYL